MFTSVYPKPLPEKFLLGMNGYLKWWKRIMDEYSALNRIFTPPPLGPREERVEREWEALDREKDSEFFLRHETENTNKS